MTTLEELYGKAKSAAAVAGQKTGELVELTKLKWAVTEAEKELSAYFEKLGKLTYAAQKTNTDRTAETETVMALIEKQKATIADLYEAIAAVKNGVRCPLCNTVNDNDSAYCKKCGAAL